MKKLFLISFLSLLTLPLLFAQKPKDQLTEKGAATLSKEELAVKQVIEDETKYFDLRDYENWSKCVAHDPMTVYSWTTPFQGENSVFEAKGWDEVSKHMKKNIETWPAKKEHAKKYDYKFKVNGNMAYVTFLEGNGIYETRVLEKKADGWKILRMEATASPMFEAMHKKYALQRLAGHWNMDPSTIKAEGGEGWTLQAAEVKVKKTDYGLKASGTVYFKSPEGEEHVIEEENMLSYDLGTGKIAMWSSSYFPNSGWSEGSLGEGEVDENGAIHFTAHRVGKEGKEKGMIKIKEDGNLHYEVKRFDKDGKQVFAMSYAMVKSKPVTEPMKP